MTQVERIREVCKKQGIAIKKLENDLKYGNGFLNPKKIKVVSSDRLFEIAKYLNVSASFLAGQEEPAANCDGLDVVMDYLRSLPVDRLRGILLALGAPAEVIAALDRSEPPL